MNIIDSYELWYDGAGRHNIISLAKNDIAANANDYALAEWMLAKYDAALGHGISSYTLNGREISSSASKDMNYIKHIHSRKAEEIKSKWQQPQLSDDEAAAILFDEQVEPQLDEIEKSFEQLYIWDILGE
jgi:hypothetical protein